MLGLVQAQLRSEDSMAHFAELNNVNVVMRVLVVHNNELMVDGVELEERGVKFLQSLFGTSTVWKQTSYNNNMRGKYAGVGYVYNPNTDEFLTPEEAAEIGLPTQQEVPADLPAITLTEPIQETVEPSQAQVDLTSAALPAFTSEQITGL
jgi:hypothetical protein